MPIVDSVADALKEALSAAGAMELSRQDWMRLSQVVLAKPGTPTEEGVANKTYVGRDASLLLTALGMEGAEEPAILFADVEADDPFVVPVVAGVSERNTRSTHRPGHNHGNGEEGEHYR